MMTMPVDVQPGQAARPPRFEFYLQAEEDRPATQAANNGKIVYKDVDMVRVRPLGSYHEGEYYAETWLREMEREPFHYILVKAYDAFKAGKEAPVDGTPIELCTMFTPAEIKTIRAGGCRTPEDLAQWPDSSLGSHFGMGAVRLKQKAQAWVASAKDVGGTAVKLADQAAEIETLKQQVAQLLSQQAEAKETLKNAGERPTLSIKKDNAA